MKAIAINGSPRKKWNTAQLLQHALDGAAEAGAETETVHLYDLNYKGCISCFECKKIGGKSYGRCAVQDDLAPVLEKALAADVLLIGSPFYLHAETGEMRSFLERLVFAPYTYTPEGASLYEGKVRTGLFYTMNVKEEMMKEIGQDKTMKSTSAFLTRVLGHCETQLCFDTLQFNDYSKYLCTVFDGDAKKQRNAEVFPQDCAKAFALGKKLAEEAKAL